jgi:ABC-type uncharacterized transport system involved in gliding motility auxiliary subunit
VRSRGTYSRPFTRVIELQRAAAEDFRLEEERLSKELQQTEDRLAGLERATGEQGELSLEQQRELEAFEKKRVSIQRKLREVQHTLNKDIEQLGVRLKYINMFAVPSVLLLLGFLIPLLGKRRARR